MVRPHPGHGDYSIKVSVLPIEIVQGGRAKTWGYSMSFQATWHPSSNYWRLFLNDALSADVKGLFWTTANSSCGPAGGLTTERNRPAVLRSRRRRISRMECAVASTTPPRVCAWTRTGARRACVIDLEFPQGVQPCGVRPPGRRIMGRPFFFAFAETAHPSANKACAGSMVSHPALVSWAAPPAACSGAGKLQQCIRRRVSRRGSSYGHEA